MKNYIRNLQTKRRDIPLQEHGDPGKGKQTPPAGTYDQNGKK